MYLGELHFGFLSSARQSTLFFQSLGDHADNFFAFGSSAYVGSVSKALSASINGLPEGDFEDKSIQHHPIGKGFKMPGCWLLPDSAEMVDGPTTDHQEKLRCRVKIFKRSVAALLITAAKEKSEALRMESLVVRWVSAFNFCEIIIDLIEAVLQATINQLKYTHQITEQERKALRDASIKVNLNHCSG